MIRVFSFHHWYRRLGLLNLLAVALFLLLFRSLVAQTYEFRSHRTIATTSCSHLNGSDDVFVVVKTGASEIHEKLPFHLETSFRCLRNVAVFSDFNESFSGVHIHDTFERVDDELKRKNKDFEIYWKLQEKGSKGLKPSDLDSGPATNNGKSNNAAWKLDKWKFLPIVDEMVRMRPGAKWHIMIETDTYISWYNLFKWLAWLDASKEEYIGSPMQIGDIVFAYGGSGIIFSESAAKKASAEHQARLSEINALTEKEWAGDYVLGKVMNDVGVPLHWAWPLMYTEHAGNIDPTEDKYGKRLWCYPLVAVHHMQPYELKGLWDFEQKWRRQNPDRLLLYSDFFKGYVVPAMSASRDHWDNLSATKEEPMPRSVEECEMRCRNRNTCLQYSWTEETCYTSDHAQFGHATDKQVHSGRILDRIEDMIERMPRCDVEPWF